MACAISVVIPVYNSAKTLRQCLEHLRGSTVADYECIVVDDGSTDPSPQVAAEFGVTVLQTGKRSGPAFARNLGASKAEGKILFFIDADVCVYPDTLDRVLASFTQDPGLTALIGSYDDQPEAQDFLSLYRNLMHCYVHHQAHRAASTFWSGCGAILRSVFHEYSGFDVSYDRPSIEDIELGYRLSQDKKKMVLDPTIQVKHLKRWSFFSLVKTDILDRGIPWTELILNDRVLPNDLNVQLSQRVSIALVYILIAITAVTAWYVGSSFILMLLVLLFLVLAQFEVESTWRTQPKLIVATTVLIASMIGMAFYNHTKWVIPPVLLAYLMLFLRHRYSLTKRGKQITGLVCGGYLLLVILFVVVYLPRQPMVFCFFLLLSIVVMLNSQFYVFLAGRTGRLLALAAIPFHLLFQFYNVVSFIFGVGRHLFRRIFSTASKRASVLSDR